MRSRNSPGSPKRSKESIASTVMLTEISEISRGEDVVSVRAVSSRRKSL